LLLFSKKKRLLDLMKSRPLRSGDYPLWEREGLGWPNREASRFVRAGGIEWHVQMMGQGPALLLVHGTGAATHSWRDLAPLLAENFTVIAPDLPGHGFTEALLYPRMSLPGMAAALAALLIELKVKPELAVGHSAGAAILIRMGLDKMITPKGLVSLNGALLPMHGPAGRFFSPLAQIFALNPLVPWLFSRRSADISVVRKLLRGTGSELDEAGVEFYARLARRSGHSGSALTMMAKWDLETLAHSLPGLTSPLLLVVGEGDRSIAPSQAEQVRRLVKDARVERLPGLGHLAHEEAPVRVADLIRQFAAETGVLAR
jgi:magnesium chelatase accessory protein